MWKAILKGLLGHKLRLGLTILAIVLGVGFIAGTYVLTDTISATFDGLFADVTEGVDVYVRSKTAFTSLRSGEDREPVRARVLELVGGVEGVASAQGSVGGYAQIVDKTGEAITPVGPPTLGVSWNPAVSPLTVARGRRPERAGEVAIDAGTAEEYGFRVGDSVTILTAGGAENFTLVGIARFGRADNLAGATLAAFDLETAQDILDRENSFDAIEIVAAEGTTALELRSRIDSVLPDHLVVDTAREFADEQAGNIQEGLGFLQDALLVFAGVALFVGAFIIYNTFTIIVAQRTRELALLRALGASSKQVMFSVVTEAAIVGLVASAMGLAFGVLVAVALRELMAAFGIELPQTELQFIPRTAVASFAVGTLVTTIAAFLPARRGARISPMEALREAVPQTYRPSRRRMLIGAGMTASGVALLLSGMFRDTADPLPAVGLGSGLAFVGVAVSSPVFARPLSRAIGAFLPHTVGVAGKLARENAARNPKRTAATAAALMIGLALVSLTSIFAASLKASAEKLISESLRADFIVANLSLGNAASFSPEIAQRIEAAPEIAAAAALRFGQWRHDEEIKELSAVDAEDFTATATLGEVTGASLAALVDGGVFVHRDAALDLGLRVGETLPMEFAATGAKRVRIEGIFTNDDFVAPFVISLQTHAENYSEDLDDAVFVRAARGFPVSAARSALERAIELFPNVEVQDQVEFRDEQSRQIDRLLGLVITLLALALVIALLGITNTLALSVFERTREIGLLRAVGMTRRQVRVMIRWESVIIAVMGAVLGLIVGICFGWALVAALADEGITELRLPGERLLVYLAASGIAGVAAAVLPARRAASLDVLQAVATE